MTNAEIVRVRRGNLPGDEVVTMQRDSDGSLTVDVDPSVPHDEAKRATRQAMQQLRCGITSGWVA